MIGGGFEYAIRRSSAAMRSSMDWIHMQTFAEYIVRDSYANVMAIWPAGGKLHGHWSYIGFARTLVLGGIELGGVAPPGSMAVRLLGIRGPTCWRAPVCDLCASLDAM